MHLRAPPALACAVDAQYEQAVARQKWKML
jgi:hypothetical protein